MVLTGAKDEALLKMTRNIPGIVTKVAPDVSVMDLINNQGVVVSKAGIEELTKNLTK
jgi:ribosomal protein L4